MIKNWTDEHTRNFQKTIMSFDHGLVETGLFSDDALAELLDKHPEHMLDVCTRGQANDPEYPNKLRTGDFRGVKGRDIIQAAREGWIWINVREAMNIHPEYKALLDQMYGDISQKTGKTIYTPKGAILITSPVARTPYHFDKTHVILWHIRGKKRMYVYPLKEPFITDEMYEQVLINPINDDLPYYPSFDEDAEIFDLQEGQAMTWPLNAPHRVENSELCISVTTEYSTRESGIKNAAMIANATFRKRLGAHSSYSDQSEAGRMIRSIVGRAMKKTGIATTIKPKDMVSFKIDPSIPGYIVNTPPFERNF